METFTIASLAVQVRGVSYKPEDLHSSLDDSSVILLRANNIDDGRINFDDVVFVDKKRVSNEQFLRKGDILVCASSGSKNLVGKAASVDFDKEVTFGAFCKAVRPRNIEDADYLAMFFLSPIYRRQIAATAIGANINNIRNEHIDTLSVKWPATVKRKEIVDILSKAETIIRIRKKQLSALDDLIKARFVEMFGEQESNPLRWTESTVGECCTLKSGTTLPTEKEDEGGPVPYVKVGDMNYPGNERYITTSSRHVTIETAGKGLFEVGSVLFPKRGGAIGTNKKRLTTLPVCADLNVMGVSSNGDLLPEYLFAFFDLVDLGSLSDGSSVPQINNKNIAPLKICIPPMELQKQFAAFVSQIDKSKSVIQKSLDETQLLFDSLMQQYFG